MKKRKKGQGCGRKVWVSKFQMIIEKYGLVGFMWQLKSMCY